MLKRDFDDSSELKGRLRISTSIDISLFLFYTALTCYKCDSVDQPAHCYQTANCQADEICMISTIFIMFTDLYDITESKVKWRPVLQPGLFCKSGITTSITSTTSSPTQPACQDSNLPICKNPKTISLVCRELDLRINCKKTCGLCRKYDLHEFFV
ncbi:unnamed protein product [Mytilus coruscus]|uniref:ShKT domain-containing protein n=1 Tax=Mytilus coruscus TaxID=42192 RepID=A0A6J8A359_MYTCO|nr:unnamed protein product [Mytilus coruscus]